MCLLFAYVLVCVWFMGALCVVDCVMVYGLSGVCLRLCFGVCVCVVVELMCVVVFSVCVCCCLSVL